MKRYSIVTQFLLAASLFGLGKIAAQEPVPIAVSAPASAPATQPISDPPAPVSGNGSTSVTVSNFLRLFVDQLTTGKASINTLNLLVTDVKQNGWTGEFLFGTDFGVPQPGLWQAQTMRVEGLSLTKEFRSGSFTLGTEGLWGPEYANQLPGQEFPRANSTIEGFGGAYGGMVGGRFKYKFGTAKLNAETDEFVGTADRGLTGGLKGIAYPSLCQHNNNVCGVDYGTNVDVHTTALPGFTFNAQVTRLGNGGDLRDERHITGGAEERFKTGPIKWNGGFWVTHDIHYNGGISSLDLKTGSLSGEKEIGKGFAIGLSAGSTHASGALAKNYTIVSSTLTYRNKNNNVSISYGNEPSYFGHTALIATWSRVLGTLHK